MLTISRTPVRVSFFGGGTDYPDYYRRRPGAVLGTTINKYIYISSLPMVSFAVSRYRLTYRVVENVDHVKDIQHPVVRAVLGETGYDEPLNIATMSDIPGGTGLGSSSAFTVGFLNLVYSLQKKRPTRYDLATEAIRVELEVLRENVGIQDQLHAAYGGLAKYSFEGTDITIKPIRMHTDCRDLLNQALMLVFTGNERSASASVAEQIENTKSQRIDKDLSHLLTLTEQAVGVMEKTDPRRMLAELGEMLSDGWRTKRNLSSSLSTRSIDEVYETGIKLGAWGGKLCGAGGGGFFLFLVPPEKRRGFIETFGERKIVDIEMEEYGSRVLAAAQT